MAETFNASSYLLDRHLAAGAGDRVAVTGPRGVLTYAELHTLTCRVAAGLRELGLQPEQRVLLFMVDGPHMLATILAAMRIGAVPVPVSTMLQPDDLTAILADSRARVLVVSEEFAGVAERAAAGADELTTVVVDGETDVAAPGRAVHRFGVLAGADPAAGTPYPTVADSTGLWLYTSGTTGTPKAAMHRHGSIRYVAETYGAQVLGIRPDDRCLSVAKLFFAYGIGNSCFFPLSVGAAAVLEPARPTPQSIAERLLEERPTLFFAVPTFFAALLQADVPREAFDSVRMCASAGEPLPAELLRRFTARYGVDILDGIGSTEALHIFLSNRPDDIRPGTTGTPVPGYAVRLVDDTGNDVEPGQPGHLLVRGESIATGYWCRTEITRRMFLGEWLRTGDTYVRSPEGYYTCLGRSDDMIKVGGIWVSPAEVEARLIEHPGVAQVAVVAVADADGLDKPVACVVRAPGSSVSAEELVEFCRAGLASFKRPRTVLFFDELPTTATGKLRRFVVRAQAVATMRPAGPPPSRSAAAVVDPAR